MSAVKNKLIEYTWQCEIGILDCEYGGGERLKGKAEKNHKGGEDHQPVLVEVGTPKNEGRAIGGRHKSACGSLA